MADDPLTRLRSVLGIDLPAREHTHTSLGASRNLSRGLVVVCVVVVGFTALIFIRSRPIQTFPSSTAVTSPAEAALGLPTSSPSASALSGASTPLAEVVVYVTGRVRHPGLITLPKGSRVGDAVAAAGGLLRRTDPATINLARLVIDGEQINIGQAGSVPGSASAPGALTAPGAATAGGLLDINTATLEQFDSLPGVGPVLAQRIVDQRTKVGGFTSINDLRDVSGIGAKKFADLSALVRCAN